MRRVLSFGSTLIALLLLAAIVVPAFAWDENVNTSRNCEGVTVTASPENEYTDHSGQNQERWHPISIEGTGFFPWNGNPHLEGFVRVRYQLQRSTNWGISWSNVNPAQYSYGDGWIHWSKDRSGQCPPFEIPGCTDPKAENYDPNANVDDGSCIYYEVCSETVVTVGVWGDWLVDLTADPPYAYRVRTITVLDARDGSDCGSHLQYDFDTASLYCLGGTEVWLPDAEEIPDNAVPGHCPPVYPCQRVDYGETLEGLSIEIFGGPSYYYRGFLVVCTEHVALDWGENCVPALGFAPENFVPGLWVCPAPSPGTGE